MGAAREPTQEDFDLERFIEMFDEALTSNDERVVNALRSLMMMVILTKSETRNSIGKIGPLRQLFDDMHTLNRRMRDMEHHVRNLEHKKYDYEKYDWPKHHGYDKITIGDDIAKIINDTSLDVKRDIDFINANKLIQPLQPINKGK